MNMLGHYLLNDLQIREAFKARYIGTASLYYNGQPDFDKVLDRISHSIHLL